MAANAVERFAASSGGRIVCPDAGGMNDAIAWTSSSMPSGRELVGNGVME